MIGIEKYFEPTKLKFQFSEFLAMYSLLVLGPRPHRLLRHGGAEARGDAWGVEAFASKSGKQYIEYTQISSLTQMSVFFIGL